MGLGRLVGWSDIMKQILRNCLGNPGQCHFCTVYAFVKVIFGIFFTFRIISIDYF